MLTLTIGADSILAEAYGSFEAPSSGFEVKSWLLTTSSQEHRKIISVKTKFQGVGVHRLGIRGFAIATVIDLLKMSFNQLVHPDAMILTLS